MRCGGNIRLKNFFHGQKFPSDLTLQQRYNSEAARLYREWLVATSQGLKPDSIPIVGFVDLDVIGGTTKPGRNFSVQKPTPTPPRRSKFSILTDVFMCFFFLYAAIVQLNDPDW